MDTRKKGTSSSTSTKTRAPSTLESYQQLLDAEESWENDFKWLNCLLNAKIEKLKCKTAALQNGNMQLQHSNTQLQDKIDRCEACILTGAEIVVELSEEGKRLDLANRKLKAEKERLLTDVEELKRKKGVAVQKKKNAGKWGRFMQRTSSAQETTIERLKAEKEGLATKPGKAQKEMVKFVQ